MPVFQHHKAIFVHIPKNGGSTITTMLKRKRFLDLRRYPEDPRGKSCETIAQYMAAIGDEAEDYFKFSFVRNPWDRLVSAFHYIKQRRPELNEVQQHATFETFVSALSKEPEAYLGIRYLRPQWPYVSGADGEIPLDFVGRFERFDDDTRQVLSELGVSRPWVRHRKRSKRGEYQEYYNTQTQGAVAEVYRRDIETFGYQFENDD